MFWVGPTCSPTPTGRWIPVAFSAQAKMIFSTPPHRHTEAPVLQLLKESGMLWLKQVAHNTGASQNTLLLRTSLIPPSPRKGLGHTVSALVFCQFPVQWFTVILIKTSCDEIWVNIIAKHSSGTYDSDNSRQISLSSS